MASITSRIAIVPTACGIETDDKCLCLEDIRIAIVPTACGIETQITLSATLLLIAIAIVPTACGIETKCRSEVEQNLEKLQ